MLRSNHVFTRYQLKLCNCLISGSIRAFCSNNPFKMRIPYVEDPPPVQSPDDQAIVDRVRARRGARGLTSLDLALLHSPPVANGWYVCYSVHNPKC